MSFLGITYRFTKIFKHSLKNIDPAIHYHKYSSFQNYSFNNLVQQNKNAVQRYLSSAVTLLNDKKDVEVSKSGITPLLKQLQSKIRFTGPLTIHDYMKEVLINPSTGYYTKKDDIFGGKGDYVTSPDISQMFGEMIGIWIYNEWVKMGKVTPLNIVELGPGNASLLEDVLNTLKKIGFDLSKDAIIHLVEISDPLTDAQQQKLCDCVTSNLAAEQQTEKSYYRKCTTKMGAPIFWYRHLVGIPKGFSIFLANEFFDVLPIHKFHKTEEGWRELLIDIDEGPGPHHLRYILSRNDTPVGKLLIPKNDSREEIEICPDAITIVSDLSKRLVEHGGAALIIDYGHNGTLSDTFRAFRNHQQISPLLEPGTADITADVDFSLLRLHAGDNVLCFGPINQGFFLKNMGIELRLMNLLKNKKNHVNQKKLIGGYKMLIDNDKMGQRFKFFAMYPQTMKLFLKKYPPAGFFRIFEYGDDKQTADGSLPKQEN